MKNDNMKNLSGAELGEDELDGIAGITEVSSNEPYTIGW